MIFKINNIVNYYEDKLETDCIRYFQLAPRQIVANNSKPFGNFRS